MDGQAADAQAEQGSGGWWPLNCLRSLGRAASIAHAGQPFREHADYRDFRILTTGQDGSCCARVTHWQGQAVRMNGQLKNQLENARFGSHEEAAQHARFLIASGALNHLRTGAHA